MAVDVPLEATKFANGSHTLKVTVQDAAGNSAVVYDGTITIANNSATAGQTGSATGTPIGPGSPLALRGASNGTNASDLAKLTALWAGTAKATRTSRYGRIDRVNGRLTTLRPAAAAWSNTDPRTIVPYHWDRGWGGDGHVVGAPGRTEAVWVRPVIAKHQHARSPRPSSSRKAELRQDGAPRCR